VFKNVTKVYFDESVIGVGAKIHVRRVLSCKLYKEIATNKVYDIDDDAEVIDVIEAEDCNEIDTIKVKFKTYRYMYYGEEYDDEEIDIDDVLSGEWEIQII